MENHARRVLRLRADDPLILFDGKGSEFEAVFVPDPLNASRSYATITRGGPVDREALLRITLVQALSSQDKLDWLVEKAVELGADRIVLAPAARSLVRLSGPRRERRADRWREIAVAACCQCGRNRLPSVEISENLETALRSARTSSAQWILEPAAQSGLHRASGDSVTCAVGPEGGFADEELALARSLGYAGARLGRRVLRTETAGLVAISALLAFHGEFA